MKKTVGPKGPPPLRFQGARLETIKTSADHISEGYVLLMAMALKTPAEVMTWCSPEPGSRPTQKPGLNDGAAIVAKCFHAP